MPWNSFAGSAVGPAQALSVGAPVGGVSAGGMFMGLLESLKKGTGIGLRHDEHYARAFERGVLLGPAKYHESVTLFDEAARRAGEAGDGALQARAKANAALYGFLCSGRPEYLVPLAEILPHLAEIEVIGSSTETMPAALLLGEVRARLTEADLANVRREDHVALAGAHDRAAGAFKAIFNAPLLTYRFQASDPHVEAAQTRYFFHAGLAAWHEALAAVAASPEGGAERMGKALAAFRQCNDGRWADDAEAWLASCRMKRTCWMCHREVQGATVHFKSYPATVAPYVVSVVDALGQDRSMLDARGFLVLCTPCGSVVERQAEAYANLRAEELRRHYDAQLAQLQATIAALGQRVAALAVARSFR